MEQIKQNFNIKEQWKIHCRWLYQRVLDIKKQAEINYMELRKNGKEFSERKILLNKIKKCEEYKKKINESAKSKEFNLTDENVCVILSKGFDYYFKIYETI